MIKGFILQGGDPTGTGKGGESIWGRPFKDEIQGTYKHDQRGVLSMANRGSDTNNSQFFITFAATPHLDGKHTVFGRLVGGAQTLCAIENSDTNEEDRPVKPVIFMKGEVFVDPFEEAAETVKREREMAAAKGGQKDEIISKEEEEQKEKVRKPKAFSTGVGKYIRPEVKSALKKAAAMPDGVKDEGSVEMKKRRPM